MLEPSSNYYHPVKAFGGTEALAILRRESIDLVLLDWYMPEVGGLEVLQEMRETPNLADIPVIVISGRYPETEVPKAGQNLIVVRTGKSSVFEIIGYLEALVDILPLKGVIDVESVQESPAAPADPLAS
jgi:CheY-like chemotaxis protein